MISDKDRSGWFGASDTATIMGSWNTETFAKWWAVKLGIATGFRGNAYTCAGTYYEHAILESIGVTRMDRQILVPEYHLRVNLDGEDDEVISEVKTYVYERGFKPSKAYIGQVRVQMYVANKRGRIVAYGLTDREYKNFFCEIEKARLLFFEIEQDETFIQAYLRRLKVLSRCLDEGVFPAVEMI